MSKCRSSLLALQPLANPRPDNIKSAVAGGHNPLLLGQGTNHILVTGAVGWLGSRLVEALLGGLPDCEALKEPRRAARIRCLVLPGQDASALPRLPDRVEFVTGDLRDAADCDRFCQGARGALLFHTAGLIHPRRIAELVQRQCAGHRPTARGRSPGRRPARRRGLVELSLRLQPAPRPSVR